MTVYAYRFGKGGHHAIAPKKGGPGALDGRAESHQLLYEPNLLVGLFWGAVIEAIMGLIIWGIWRMTH